MKKFKILISTTIASLSMIDLMDIEKVKESIQKINKPENIHFELIEKLNINPYKKFKEPKRNFTNKFNKNSHRK
jgi:hypothetical protein